MIDSAPSISTETEHDFDARRTALEAEVAGRFGVMPNFFRPSDEAFEPVRELWGFAKSAYLDNPLPPLFKERLFVHLSRFCHARYCIVRHVGFLIGHGRPAGDPDAPPHNLDQVAALLRRPGMPDATELEAVMSRLEASDAPTDPPEPESQREQDVFAAASVLFLNPLHAGRARQALRTALGGRNLELVTAYLAFIRTAHYWTVTHPELGIEEDMEALLRDHEEFAALVLDDTDASQTEIGQRLYEELELLRRERDDRKALREALAERERAQKHQELLINELNHRVKNTLAIVQSLAFQTLRRADVPPEVNEAFTNRLMALSGAHDLLTRRNWEGADLKDVIIEALRMHFAGDGRERIHLEGPTIHLTPQTAVSLSMAVHELATNAAKYGALSNDEGRVEVVWTVSSTPAGQRLKLQWQESGGPIVTPPRRRGFGTRLIERGVGAELGGTVTLSFEPTGARCTIDAPFPDRDEAL